MTITLDRPVESESIPEQLIREYPAALEVILTDDDISLGRRGSTVSCPIALALRRQYTFVSVGAFTARMRFTTDIQDRFYLLCESARAFVSDFDYGKQVQPGRVWMLRNDVPHNECPNCYPEKQA